MCPLLSRVCSHSRYNVTNDTKFHETVDVLWQSPVSQAWPPWYSSGDTTLAHCCSAGWHRFYSRQWIQTWICAEPTQIHKFCISICHCWNGGLWWSQKQDFYCSYQDLLTCCSHQSLLIWWNQRKGWLHRYLRAILSCKEVRCPSELSQLDPESYSSPCWCQCH